MEYTQILKERYATKKFDKKEVPKAKIEELKEMIQLSPSSFGLQPWKVKIITDEKTKEKLLEHSWNQEQVTTCSHLFVICADKNAKSQIEKYEKLMKEKSIPQDKINMYIGIMNGWLSNMKETDVLTWAQKQCYIPMTNLLNGAKALGLDSCPMEGFNSQKYSEILKLPANLIPTLVVPVGYAADKQREKIRYSQKEMFI